ncbi:hypothetical protein LX81_02175 [Palleronia aestuarii]|uniref:Uncharacterized protein n=1 Tax=Palleronia aestuarii TaxID=568105 RepID=A0A2W7N9J2_9RHOB|nr:hypothetical protein [Palleronia aestuarii]PZX16323.1 hypothetical protein LX81_02175 [Palleronia aestuarii]
MSDSIHLGSIFLKRSVTAGAGTMIPVISISPTTGVVESTIPGAPHPWKVNDVTVTGVTENPTTLAELGANAGDVISAKIKRYSAQAIVPDLPEVSPPSDNPIIITINATFDPASPTDQTEIRLVAPETADATAKVSLDALTLDSRDIRAEVIERDGDLVLPQSTAGVLQAEWRISTDAGYFVTTIETTVTAATAEEEADAGTPVTDGGTDNATDQVEAPGSNVPGNDLPTITSEPSFEPALPKTGQTVSLLPPTVDSQTASITLKSVLAGGIDVTGQVREISGTQTITVSAPGELVATWRVADGGAELAVEAKVVVSSSAGADLEKASVIVHRVDDVAPSGAIFEIKDISEDVYATAGFVWEFSDGGDYKALRDGHPWKIDGKRWCLTPKAVRVFETPGQVKWTLDIHYKGQHRRLSGSLDVRDPATVVPDANRFHVSPSGTFPKGAANTFASFDAAQKGALARSKDIKSPVAILFRAGEEHSAGFIEAADGFKNGLWITRYGDGVNPLLKPRSDQGSILTLRSFQGVKTSGLDFKAGWDQSTETNSLDKLYDGIAVENFNRHDYRTNLLLHDCRFEGCRFGVNMTVSVTNQDGKAVDFGYHSGTAVLSELQAIRPDTKGWSSLDYNFYGAAERIGFCGIRSNQHPDALGGGYGKNNTHNQHGIVRLVSARSAVMWAFDGDSKVGWTKVGSNKDGGLLKQIPAHQPVIRWGASGWLLGSESCLGGAVAEGGSGIHVGTSSSNAVSRPGRHTICNNLVVASANSMSAITAAYAGTSVHTNIVICPDSRPEYYSGFQNFIQLWGPGTQDEFGSIDFKFWAFSNSLINLNGKPCNKGNVATGGAVKEIIVSNNLVHAPKEYTGAVTSHGPLDDTVILQPQYKGHRWADSPKLDTAYATPANTVSLYRPLEGAGAIGAADPAKPVSELDFFGRLRGAVKNIGAI